MTQDTSTTAPRRVVDLDTLTGLIADSLASPTHALDGDDTGDGFVTFDANVVTMHLDGNVIRAVVNLVSDGEDPVEGAAGEVIEIVVRYPGATL